MEESDYVYLVNNLSPDGDCGPESEQVEAVYRDHTAALAYARAANDADVINRRIVEVWSVGGNLQPPSRITAISFNLVSFEVQR